MKLQFLGGAQTVTGSMHLVQIHDKKILLECGLFQGARQEMYEKNQNFPFDPSEIDYLLLSHAHIDHSGNIPNLVKKGFQGKILATGATIDLCSLLLPDSAYLQEMDVRWVNKVRAKSHKPPVQPLYRIADVPPCLPLFRSVEYNQEIELGSGIKVTFRDAGHIMGSAGIILEWKEGGHERRLGFSGDIGRANTVITRDPDPPRELDYLIMETTYGNRHHEHQDIIEEDLAQLVIQATKKGSKIIIPSFAVGRTQQLVYYLHKLHNQHRIPDIPIYVDSPLARKATEVFRHCHGYMDDATCRLFLDGQEDPFGFSRLTYVDTVEESQALNNLVVPHIIISASGMCEGGRVLHHLKNNIGNPNAILLFVGYAAEHTLARKIMDGNEEVSIFGESYRVKAQIKIMGAFSAHADRRELLDYVRYCDPKRLKHLFLVHGEKQQSESLIDAFRSKGYEHVYLPEPGKAYEFPA